MPEPFVIRVVGHPPALNSRMHWAARSIAVKQYREWAELQTLSQRNERGGFTCDRVRVSAVIRSKGRGVDPDNRVGLCKALIDGLVSGGLIPDDSGKHVELGTFTHEHGERAIVLTAEVL